ncbi:MAG: division/cell wall cluster transcriptional repressor MraZ [Ignavibacteriaceae bacterium]|nr:division/cell wall cluster transcriptional repressor MraZ [Ignavibacteriaceae bacterium]
MFKSHIYTTIDSKNRISIPAKIRKSISPAADNTLVLLNGVGTDDAGHPIDVYPKDLWLQIEENLKSLKSYNKQSQLIIRTLLFSAEEEEMDSQFRIVLPQHLIKHAKIEKDILILGALRKFEIWNPEIYEKYRSSSDMPLENLAEAVIDF